MNRDEKIAWLRRYSESDNEIERIVESITRWKSRSVAMTSNLTHMPKSTQTVNGLVRAVEKMEELQLNLAEKINAQHVIRAQIETAIENLPLVMWREVLKIRYIENMPVSKIADKMGYSTRQVMRHHTAALDALIVPTNNGIPILDKRKRWHTMSHKDAVQ